MDIIKEVKKLLFNIDREINVVNSLKDIVELIKKFSIRAEEIIKIVLTEKIDAKDKILNDLAVYCFHEGLYDYIVPFLKASYDINNQHLDTIYNLGYFLNFIGEKRLALKYLESVKEKDAQILTLINEVKSSMQKIKDDIMKLIVEGKTTEAEKMTEENKNVLEDKDEYIIKGLIAIKKGNLDEAERILEEGLRKDEDDFNSNYYMALLYKIKCKYKLSEDYYKRALDNAKNDEEREQVYKDLQYLYYDYATYLEKKGIKSDAAVYYGLSYRYAKDEDLKNKLENLYTNNKTLRNIFDVAKQTQRRRYIILSSCGWGSIYQRPHHIARSLTKFGHEVMYVTPTVKVHISGKDFTVDDLVRYTFDNKIIVDGVNIFVPISVEHNGKEIITNYVEVVQKLIDSTKIESEPVIITYMPYQVNVIKSLKGRFTHIYECVDDHTDLENAFWGTKKDSIWEQELMDLADGITTTSHALYLERVAIEKRENVFLSRNAVNEEDFLVDNIQYIPEDLRNIPKPRIVYVGAIYNWFDKELFYNIIEANPDKSFVVIGFGDEKILDKKFNNLYFLGAKKHSELRNYLRYMQIGIIPFKDDENIVIGCDPIKQYEYLACGLPVITTYMPEAAIDKPYTFLANTAEEFNKAIRECLCLKCEKEVIENFLVANSWNARAALLCRIADKAIAEEEKESLEKHIKEMLDNVVQKYKWPIFQAMKAAYLNLEDGKRFEEASKEVYNLKKTNYTERQYLKALIQNHNIADLINVILNSSFVKEELKEEILYLQKTNNLKGIFVIGYICTNDIKTALKLIEELDNENLKVVYHIYLKTLLEEPITQNERSLLFSFNHDSYIYKFLKRQIKREEIKNIYFNFYNQPFISIIIPTRNSADVVGYALKTCIEQNYDNYEIIVSDNSSPEDKDTRRIVEELNCKKIKYYRTNGNLAMIENYEFAYEKANGEYMIILGSDDGLLLHCLEVLPNLIKQFNYPLSISWDVVAYGWPNVAINSIRNGLFIPYPTQKRNIKYSIYDESVLKAVLNFEMRYSVLPMFYYNSVIKRDLAEKIKKKVGKIFYCPPPDVYTGIVFAYLQRKYIYVHMPMTIGGSSHKSCGVNGLAKFNNFIGNNVVRDDTLEFEIKKLYEFGVLYEKFNAPYFAGEEGAVLIAALKAKELFFAGDNNFEVNVNNFFKACTKYLFNDENLEEKKTILYECILRYGDESLIKWYEDNYLNNKYFVGYENYFNRPLVPMFMENGGLIIDASKFCVTNVYEAAKLYRNIVGY